MSAEVVRLALYAGTLVHLQICRWWIYARPADRAVPQQAAQQLALLGLELFAFVIFATASRDYTAHSKGKLDLTVARADLL
jgi:hypothetical protein